MSYSADSRQGGGHRRPHGPSADGGEYTVHSCCRNGQRRTGIDCHAPVIQEQKKRMPELQVSKS